MESVSIYGDISGIPVMYVQVILPLKYRGEVTYSVPEEMIDAVVVGSCVKVDFAGRVYTAVVECIYKESGIIQAMYAQGVEMGVAYKDIIEVETLLPVSEHSIRFWYEIAGYYLCTVGEIYRASYPNIVSRQRQIKSRKTPEDFFRSIGILLNSADGDTNTKADEQSVVQSSTQSGVQPGVQLSAQPCVPSGVQTKLQVKIQAGVRTDVQGAGQEDEREEKVVETKPEQQLQPRFAGCSYNLNLILPELSEAQVSSFRQICSYFTLNKKPVLLHGITGSGKTEIYINLVAQYLELGRSVLYMVPEIALSKQLQSRLKSVFGERLLVYHSKQTAAEKARIYKILSGQFRNEYLAQRRQVDGNLNSTVNDAVVVLGTRSSLFLPFDKLGFVVVDEEHDSSYKQTEPAPRYNARDAAIMLSNIYGASILLGSATPSFESEYNCRIGRFYKVGLYEKYYGATEPEVDIVDTIWARRSGQMRGNFSQKLINEMKRVLENGLQVLVFKNRRSYSPVVECTECGTIPKCPACNVYLSYHKYNNTLRCHYCDYTVKFEGLCKKCGLDTLKYKGAGTEKIEEELRSLFPEYSIARFDADIAESKKKEEAVIKEFAQGRTDILVGTQMISKGFDFEKLALVAVLDADSILGVQDFRADERALQMFNQLMGRTGRRGMKGKLIVQTSWKDHPVIAQLKNNTTVNKDFNLVVSLLEERKEFCFAPYVRMVKITLKHRNKEMLETLCNKVSDALSKIPCKEFTGPFVPPLNKVRWEWRMCFYVKFARDSKLSSNKQKLLEAIAVLKMPNSIILDVDPV